MHIISRATLRIFWETHPEAQAGLRYWYKQVSQAKWQSFQDIRQDFSSADLVGNFIVFNICGNNYRLITYVDFQHRRVFIRKILTHAEYNKNQWKKDSWFNKYWSKSLNLQISREEKLFVGWVSGSVTHAGVGFHASTQPTFFFYYLFWLNISFKSQVRPLTFPV